jgi:hypothetical protein
MARKPSNPNTPDPSTRPAADEPLSLSSISPQELRTFRDRVDILSVKVLLRTLFTVVAHQSENNLQNLHSAFSELRKTHERLVIKGIDAATSDMIAAEYQSVMENMLVFLENGLPPLPCATTPQK